MTEVPAPPPVVPPVITIVDIGCPVILANVGDCTQVPMLPLECYPSAPNSNLYYYNDPITYNLAPSLVYLAGPLAPK
jgi:hypothetical protein